MEHSSEVDYPLFRPTIEPGTVWESHFTIVWLSHHRANAIQNVGLEVFELFIVWEHWVAE